MDGRFSLVIPLPSPFPCFPYPWCCACYSDVSSSLLSASALFRSLLHASPSPLNSSPVRYIRLLTIEACVLSTILARLRRPCSAASWSMTGPPRLSPLAFLGDQLSSRRHTSSSFLCDNPTAMSSVCIHVPKPYVPSTNRSSSSSSRRLPPSFPSFPSPKNAHLPVMLSTLCTSRHPPSDGLPPRLRHLRKI